MENKNEMTLEELQSQYDKLAARSRVLREKISQKKKEDEEVKRLKLANEKEQRKKEVDEAIEKCYKLLADYTNDYGTYHTNDNIPFLFKTWNWLV